MGWVDQLKQAVGSGRAPAGERKDDPPEPVVVTRVEAEPQPRPLPAPKPRRTPPVVHSVYITVRQPTDDAPGEIDPGFYVIEDGVLTLTDEQGSPIGGKNDSALSHELANGDNI